MHFANCFKEFAMCTCNGTYDCFVLCIRCVNFFWIRILLHCNIKVCIKYYSANYNKLNQKKKNKPEMKKKKQRATNKIKEIRWMLRDI